ncbi:MULTISPECIES: alcohol dehydrogenase catalytic domain-containing protein [Streptomyces]|uniref:Alcohol dehydrogenase catalytic domain-containing protein n=1 Tax=Streptomyces rochei TaxID=1928 RepID=A0ABW7E8H7_STRRO|nr:alcohol dehydrogenase catalytic domain-containing protein [Streptomyces sp. WAC05458]
MTALPTATAAVWVHGGPEQLVCEQRPLPALGPTDVLVAVETAAVSGWDLKYRRGLQPGTVLPDRNPFPMPQQLGREAAGTVLATGSRTRLLRTGDRVAAVVHPENPHAPETYRGLWGTCPPALPSPVTRPRVPTPSTWCGASGSSCRPPTTSTSNRRRSRCGPTAPAIASCATGCGSPRGTPSR